MFRQVQRSATRPSPLRGNSAVKPLPSRKYSINSLSEFPTWPFKTVQTRSSRNQRWSLQLFIVFILLRHFVNDNLSILPYIVHVNDCVNIILYLFPVLVKKTLLYSFKSISFHFDFIIFFVSTFENSRFIYYAQRRYCMYRQCQAHTVVDWKKVMLALCYVKLQRSIWGIFCFLSAFTCT